MPEPAGPNHCSLRTEGFRSLLHARLNPLRERLVESLEQTWDPAKIEPIVRIDPILCAQILRHSREPPTGGGMPPTTIRNALMQLPANELRKLVLGIPRGRPHFDWRQGWSRCGGLLEQSLVTAAASRYFARTLQTSEEDHAYVAGLLSMLGKYAMVEKYGQAYVDYALASNCQETLCEQRESETFGDNYLELGGELARAWNLPPTLVAIISGQDDGLAMTRALREIVHKACRFALMSGAGFRSASSHPDLDVEGFRDGEITPRQREQLNPEMREVLRTAAGYLRSSYTGPGDLGRALAAARYRRPVVLPRRTVKEVVSLTRTLDPLHSTAELSRWLRELTLSHTSFERAFVFVHDEDGDTMAETISAAGSAHRPPVQIGMEQFRDGWLPTYSGPLRIQHGRGEFQEHVLLDTLSSDDLVLFSLGCRHGIPPVGLLACDRGYSRRSPLQRDLAFLEIMARSVGQAVERQRLRTRLEVYRDDAERDYLTGIYNRRFTMQLMEREILRSQRSAAPLAVILLDIDNFKAFNDMYGHLAGDVVLREVARLLRETARTSDVVGRFGGEEFLIVLPETPIENAYVFAERLRNVVEEYGQNKLTQYPDRPPTISIGVGSVNSETDTPESALDRVDRALYASKAAGRNRVCLSLSDEDSP